MMKFPPLRQTLLAAAWLTAASGVAWAAEPALTGAAWQHADQAYKAYAQGDYARALEQAQAAYRLRPDLARLRELQATAQAGVDAARATRGEQERLQRAQALAQQAYDLASSQPQQARHLMAQALQLHPQPLPWHVLGIELALQAGQWAEVVAGAERARQLHAQQPALLQAQAYSLLQQGQGAQALQLLGQVPAPQLVGEAGASLLRQAVDTALVLGQFEPGDAWVRQLQAISAPDAAPRWQLLQTRQAVNLPLPAPRLSCTADAVCAASYAFDMEQGLANAAYSASKNAQWAQVQALSQQLLQLQPTKGGYWQLLLAALQAQGRGDAARTQAQQALQTLAGQNSGLTPAELAQIAHTAGDKSAQARFYDLAEQAQAIPATQLEDAAFAAEQVGDATAAVSRHGAALDSADAGQITLLPRQRQGLRLSVGDLDRSWGSSAGLFSSRGSTLPGGQSAASGYRSVQTVGEVYWRPQALRGDGTFVDLYGRAMGNLRAAPQDARGADSAQLALGVRAKPWGQQNLIVAAERWLKVGDASRDDWLLRAAYSYTQDMVGPVDRDRWMSTELYLEAGRYLSSGEKYATGELRYGPQWRLQGSDTGDWGVWGHGVLAAEYNNSFRRHSATSAGVGVSLRRWLREDRAHAGRSWVDLTLQYRVRLGGDDRSSGLLARASWFY